ncbi:MAG: hypothetical protein SNJ77_04325 [Cytophagales bacterium]
MMKPAYNIIKILVLFFQIQIFGQSSIGINNTNPNTNAALDIVGAPLSSPQGLLIPRYSGVVDTDFGALTNDERGLVYYDLTNEVFRFYSGSGVWKTFGDSPSLVSIGLSMPNEFVVSGSPVTGTGTLTATWASQPPNQFFASPDGLAGTPVFRALVADDIPNLDASKITSGLLPLERGGTNSSLTPNAGGVFYSTATGTAITTAGTTGQVLRSNGLAAPTWVNGVFGSGTPNTAARWLDANTLTTSVIQDDGGSIGVLIEPDNTLATLLSMGGKDNAGLMGIGILGFTYSYGVRGYSNNQPGGSAIGVYGLAEGKPDSSIGVKAISQSDGPLSFGLFAEANGNALRNYGLYAGVSSGDERFPAVFMGGNVGIGTDRPKHLLHMYGEGIPRLNIQNSEVINTPNETIASIAMGDNQSFRQAEITAVRNPLLDGGTDIVFSTVKSGQGSPFERMRLGHSGNLGIGTSDPQSSLHIVGGFRLQNITAVPGRVLTATDTDGNASWQDIPTGGVSGTGSDGRLAFWNGSSSLSANNFLTFDATNVRIGIGTSFPNTRLEIMGSSTSTSISGVFDPAEVTLSIHNSDFSTANNVSSLNFNTSRASDGANYSSAKIVGVHKSHTSAAQEGELVFLTREPSNIFERMRIASNGNVGIGVSAPVQRLQVNGNVSVPNTFGYRYNSAKTLKKSVAAVEFRNTTTIGGPLIIGVDGTGTNTTGSSDVRYIAKLNLPDGCQFINSTVYVEDNSATLNIQSGLTILDLSSGIAINNPGATSSGVPGATTLGVTPGVTIVDNSTNVYMIYVVMPVSGQLRLKGAVITYSVLETD